MIKITKNSFSLVLRFKCHNVGVHVVMLTAVTVPMQHRLLADTDNVVVCKRNYAGSSQQIFGIIMNNSGNEACKISLNQSLHRVGLVGVEGGHRQFYRGQRREEFFKALSRGCSITHRSFWCGPPAELMHVRMRK